MIRGRRVELPLVSIILLVNGDTSHLSECIESILSSTYQNIAVIFASTSSSKKTQRKLNEYVKSDSRIQLFHVAKATPFQKTADGALDAARGVYLIFAEASHMVDPKRIALQLKFLEKNTDHVGVFCKSKILDKNSSKKIEYLPFSLMIARARLPFRFNPYDAACLRELSSYGKVGSISKTLLTVEHTGSRPSTNLKTSLVAAFTSHVKGTLTDKELTLRNLLKLFRDLFQGLRLAWKK